MVWRALRVCGSSRAPASIALSRRRRRTRVPVALVRLAHVRTRNWQTTSAGTSPPPAFTARATASYGRVRASPRRVRRVMRANGLLAPHRVGRTEAKPHDGTIITDKVNEMWGTDMTQTITIREGRANVFVAVEHSNSEVVGIHASRSANRFEALEPVRQGVHRCFGAIAPGVARGLKLPHAVRIRCDGRWSLYPKGGLVMLTSSFVDPGRVEVWRGGFRSNISVSASFVWRCLSGSTMTPFPHPAHRTGHADLPHPALGQDFTL